MRKVPVTRRPPRRHDGGHPAGTLEPGCNRYAPCALMANALQAGILPVARGGSGMKRKTVQRNDWTRPELVRLGTIKDVAGAQTPVAQATNVKS